MAAKQTRLTPFGIRVKKRLIDRGMTQAELAALLGCDEPYMSRILSGERSGKKYREKIAEILGIDAA